MICVTFELLPGGDAGRARTIGLIEIMLLRSRSFPGMMRAAAQQWTAHALAEVAA